MSKYPEAASVLQQLYKVLSDIENLAGCTLAKVGGSYDCTSAVNSTQENRENFCKGIDGKPHFSALYDMYTVTLNELKAALKVSGQAGQSSAVNETSVETMAQGNFQEIKRCKRHISNNTLQTAKKSTKPVPTSAAVKLPPKSVLTCNVFASFRTTDMDRETIGAEITLLKQKALR
jgi:hypothetical protein